MGADGPPSSPSLSIALSLRAPVPGPHPLPCPVTGQSGEGRDEGLASLSQSGTTLKGVPSPELPRRSPKSFEPILWPPSFFLCQVLCPSPLHPCRHFSSPHSTDKFSQISPTASWSPSVPPLQPSWSQGFLDRPQCLHRFLTTRPPLSSVQFSHSVMSDSSGPHGLQQARPPCPKPTPEFTQTRDH